MYDEIDKNKFIKELMKLKNTLIKVQLVDGNVITGKIISIDPEYLNIILEVPTKEEEDVGEVVMIPGSSISYIKWMKKRGKKTNLEGAILRILGSEPNISKEEIAKMLNIDVKNVEKVIKNLKRKGLIDEQKDNKS
ncbi:MAG: winged helix-turn-helix transcriptional regulator [archaeon YNP-LCB-003-016]|uniref:winged helix-turn-helix transcriptional regulator n=1 Tax=Candidatus Culexarchaeum yellowstonense TaxID=2928963 RepID=UPI0026F09E69|nr:winged helix-turn-helix transcriptional regulator [Candidatus Culexarchaeum yellowstonense]MCC6017469.1 winged helix-turn-helix transcriptional regulator [Candidatus Verstraetearchaeota archaeon]MCR6668489.1 winged helix-turn-helix transcriptional regulator [Candidatus Culexarchaeum yellowstonense]MCR6691233.1 winged helix-turn-helix transcriptional regulator [Candidatus Culexarchaeum yellowstonense]